MTEMTKEVMSWLPVGEMDSDVFLFFLKHLFLLTAPELRHIHSAMISVSVNQAQIKHHIVLSSC